MDRSTPAFRCVNDSSHALSTFFVCLKTDCGDYCTVGKDGVHESMVIASFDNVLKPDNPHIRLTFAAKINNEHVDDQATVNNHQLPFYSLECEVPVSFIDPASQRFSAIDKNSKLFEHASHPEGFEMEAMEVSSIPSLSITADFIIIVHSPPQDTILSNPAVDKKFQEFIRHARNTTTQNPMNFKFIFSPSSSPERIVESVKDLARSVREAQLYKPKKKRPRRSGSPDRGRDTSMQGNGDDIDTLSHQDLEGSDEYELFPAFVDLPLDDEDSFHVSLEVEADHEPREQTLEQIILPDAFILNSFEATGLQAPPTNENAQISSQPTLSHAENTSSTEPTATKKLENEKEKPSQPVVSENPSSPSTSLQFPRPPRYQYFPPDNNYLSRLGQAFVPTSIPGYALNLPPIPTGLPDSILEIDLNKNPIYKPYFCPAPLRLAKVKTPTHGPHWPFDHLYQDPNKYFDPEDFRQNSRRNETSPSPLPRPRRSVGNMVVEKSSPMQTSPSLPTKPTRGSDDMDVGKSSPMQSSPSPHPNPTQTLDESDIDELSYMETSPAPLPRSIRRVGHLSAHQPAPRRPSQVSLADKIQHERMERHPTSSLPNEQHRNLARVSKGDSGPPLLLKTANLMTKMLRESEERRRKPPLLNEEDIKLERVLKEGLPPRSPLEEVSGNDHVNRKEKVNGEKNQKVMFPGHAKMKRGNGKDLFTQITVDENGDKELEEAELHVQDLIELSNKALVLEAEDPRVGAICEFIKRATERLFPA